MDRTELAPALPKHREALLRYARTVTRDDATAEDLVQETLVRALERSESLTEPAALRGWLFRIAHNLAVDQYRRTRESPLAEPAEIVEQRWHDDSYTVDAEAVLLASERREELLDALVRLPIAYRSVVVLHDAEGWPAREIADLLQISLPAAKQRLRRGRMMLVSALAAGHERKVATAGIPLRCWDARRHVSGYLDQELAPEVARAVEKHLAGCPTCPPLYASLVAARGAVATLGPLRDSDAVVPDEVVDRIRRR